MWTPDTNMVLWDMIHETQKSTDFFAYEILDRYMNTAKWASEFEELYLNWLYNDDDAIYDVNSKIVQSTLSAISICNRHLLKYDISIFYWFDVDRDKSDVFIWKYCPISKLPLIDLGATYPSINRLISPIYPIVLPL